MTVTRPEELTPAQRWFAFATDPDGDVPEIDFDDLDLLDPWVIEGRYAADLPDLPNGDAQQLLAAAGRVVDAVLEISPELRP